MKLNSLTTRTYLKTVLISRQNSIKRKDRSAYEPREINLKKNQKERSFMSTI